jgi:AraC-like DNA-binding protein
MPDDFAFSTAAELDRLRAQARLDEWVAIHESFFWSMDFIQPKDGRFSGDVRALAVGQVGVAAIDASFTAGIRDRSHILRDSRDNYALAINVSDTPLHVVHGGFESAIETGGAVLVTSAEPFHFFGDFDKHSINIALPHAVLAAAVRHPNSRLGKRVDANNEALTLLRRYCDMLRSGAPLRSAELQEHAAETVVDLLALATGADGEAAEMANVRGLRAGRLASVLERIRMGYTRPGISAEWVGRELGLSARYVQDLLAETGTGFAERVLELRLQMTRMLLTDRSNDGLRISEIAYASGFSDISYFNRCFRRRFGCTPGSLR